LTEFEPRALASIRGALAEIDDLARRGQMAVRTAPSPSSPAAEDAPLPDARFVRIYAGQAFSTAIDHLNAWRLLANGPMVPIAAHLTLLRTALEGADRCRWHVDASIDAPLRVARGHAARRADQVERGKFEASAERLPARRQGPDYQSAVERLAGWDDPAAVAARAAAGIPSVGFTDTTRLTIDYGHERWFRLASGLAHGKEWALMATRIERLGLEFPPGSKVGYGMVTALEPVARDLTMIVVEAARMAVADLGTYTAAR
jgi:hypothetical protein